MHDACTHASFVARSEPYTHTHHAHLEDMWSGRCMMTSYIVCTAACHAVVVCRRPPCCHALFSICILRCTVPYFRIFVFSYFHEGQRAGTDVQYPQTCGAGKHEDSRRVVVHLNVVALGVRVCGAAAVPFELRCALCHQIQAATH